VKSILSPELSGPPAPLRAAITAAYACDESQHLRDLLVQARVDPATQHAIQATAEAMVQRVRHKSEDQGAIEAFMREYDLSSEEGVLLMCVAEALLRIPDAGHRRQADPRQARRGRLGFASGQERLRAGQRVHLGPDADRQAGRISPRRPSAASAAPSSAWSDAPASR
jgi:hypothetical protein